VIEAVLSHIREGIRPVPIPYREKGPVIPNWAALVITEENVGQFFNGSPMNVGGILGAPSGNLQDIDLDCPEAVVLAAAWLPPTRTFGRPSSPTSHYFYRSPDLTGEGIRQFDDPIAKLLGRKSKIIELRSNGGQTVLPGSTHKDTGELIAWDNPWAPIAECSRSTLERTVAGIAAGCMLLRYWRPSAADIFVSTFRAAGWSNEKIEGFLAPMTASVAGAVNLDAPSIDPAAWREALALPRAPERAEEKEIKKWEKAHSDFLAKMASWLGFPLAPPPPRPIRSPERRSPTSKFARASKYVAAMPEAISGSNGHTTTFAVACKLVDFELNDSEAWTILIDYNARCKPPWSERELQHKLDSARANHTPIPVEDRPRPESASRPRSASTPRPEAPEPEPVRQRVQVPDESQTGEPQTGEPQEAPNNEPSPEPDAPAQPSWGNKPNAANWRRHLLTKKVKDPVTGQAKDVVLSNQPNVCTILTFHPAWAGVLVYDSFSECVVKTKEPPWPEFEQCVRTEPQDANARRAVAHEWADLDSTQLVNWLAREESINVPNKIADLAIEVVANAMKRHPVRDYLRSVIWDGVPRLDRMLHTYFKAEDTPYTRGVSSRWMISAVARVMKPGCQADCALILESKKQGRGKSTGLEILASKEWFADSGIDIGNKDSFQNLRGVWIYELGELDAIRGRELTKVKSFLSARSDRYRPSYGHRNINVPRQGNFAGTTNESEYLQDTTGNRRFLPVRVKGEVDRAALTRDRDQLWAEAYHRYMAGEAWHVDTPEFRALCEEQQQERVRDDIWAPIIEAWFENPTITEDVDVLGTDLNGKPAVIKTQRIRTVDLNQGVLTHEIAMGALKKPTGQITRGDEMRIATILRGWGYEPTQIRGQNGQRVRRYKKVAEETELK
jgi:predicted P-loop ATPase